MRIRIALVVLGVLAFALNALAQEPTFTFTSESGKTMKGHSPAAASAATMSLTAS